MTIEFRCPTCDKLLRTGDEKAGARAKCPDCGGTITVPRPEGSGGLDDYEDFGAFDTGGQTADYDTGFDSSFGGAPQSAAYSGPTKNCPMCGAEIRAAAVKCRHCGEMLDGSAGEETSRRASRQFDAGEVISTSWEIFKSDMGLCVGGMLVLFLVMVAVSILMQFVQGAFILALAGGQRGRQPNEFLVLGIALASSMISVLFHAFIQAGQSLFFLNIARGSRPEIGNIFGGGPYYLKALVNLFLFMLLYYIGIICCIVPGIIVALMLWPFMYVIVDEDPPGLGGLGRAKEITEGNWGGAFLLGLAALAFNLLGLLACGVGLLFSAPLTALMFAVAYCRMTGQRTALE